MFVVDMLHSLILNSLSEYPLSESDAEDALDEKADVLNVKAAISEARHDDERARRIGGGE